jgi:transposase
MMITAAHSAHNTTPDRVLFTAFALSEKTEKPGFTAAMSNASRTHYGARDLQRLLDEVAYAQSRYGFCNTALVVSCCEAGRDGFWLHRFLHTQGLANHMETIVMAPHDACKTNSAVGTGRL